MNALTITDLLQARHLQELAGPNATVADVQVDPSYLFFSIPLDEPQDFYIGIVCTVYGINKGRLECSITTTELAYQLRLKRAFVQLKTR